MSRLRSCALPSATGGWGAVQVGGQSRGDSPGGVPVPALRRFHTPAMDFPQNLHPFAAIPSSSHREAQQGKGLVPGPRAQDASRPAPLEAAGLRLWPVDREAPRDIGGGEGEEEA